MVRFKKKFKIKLKSVAKNWKCNLAGVIDDN